MPTKVKRLYITTFTTMILCLVFGGRFAATQLAENDFAPPAPAPAAGVQQQAQIAKGANGSLAVWSDNRTLISRAPDFFSDGQGGGFDVYAARYDAGGNLLDAAPIIISEQLGDQIVPHVAWNGQNWLVAWLSPPISNYQVRNVVAVRVSPAGQILDAAPIVIGTSANSSDNPNYLSAASDGANWVVVWGKGTYESQIRAARVSASGSVVDAGGGGKVLFDDTNRFTAPGDAQIAFAGNQFLLVWDRLTSGGYGIRAQRFNQNLDPIDAAPFVVNQFAGSNAVSPRVATDGANFFVVWREDRFAYNEVFGTRVSAAGQILDPNGILLYGVNTNYTQQGFLAVCFDGANYVAAYHARPNDEENIFASRVAPSGTLLTPNPIVVSDAASVQPAIAPLTNGISQVVWTDRRLSAEADIFNAKIFADGTASAVAPVSLGAPRETQPRIVFTSGGNFTSVFRSTISGESKILLQRFDADGNPSDANSVVVAVGAESLRNPSVAWNGSVYLVVWELNTQIFGRRVAADGTPIGNEFLVMPGNQPDVAALDAQFLVVDDYEPTNHIRFAQAVRVDANGAVLGSPVKIGNNFDVRPRVRAFGSRWLAIWESDISHDNRTSSIQAAFVNADGTSSGEFTISGTNADTPSLAIAGDTALVVWDGFANSIYGRRIKADGTLLDTAQGISLVSAQQPLYAPSAAWDGSRFIVAYNDSRNRNLEPPDDVWAVLVGLNGAILTPGGFPVSKSPTPEQQPFVEANNGKTIFSYAFFDDRQPYSNYRIRLRKFPFDQDYFVAAAPFSRTIAPGATTTYVVSVNAQNGFGGQVNLGIENLPAGITATFNPPTIAGGGTSTLTITTAADTPENIYRFTVTATSGTQQSNAEIVLYLDDAPPPTGFSVTNLGTLGGTESEARAVNANGQVVGYAFNASQKRRAFLYTSGAMQDLGTLGGLESEANDINDAGAIVGQAKNAANNNRAFLYNGTAMQDLGTFGGNLAAASAINNANQITGWADFNTGDFHAFRYQNSVLQDLGILGGYYSYGHDINAAGKIVGLAYTDGNLAGTKAFLYRNGAMSSIGTLGGRDSIAHAINDSDQIVGSSTYTLNLGTQHAFLYANNQMQDLGTLGAAQSFAYDINNAGQVVGAVELTLFGRDYRAFLYDGTTMRNLNALIPQDSGWTLLEARGINNAGNIVGRGVINNQTRAFLLSPVGGQNAAPTVEITSPTTNRSFGDTTALTINASAFDADGAVVRVEFYADGNLIGTSASNPFAILWNAAPGTYELTAKAFDDRGAATVSAPVTITVGTSAAARTPFDFDGDGKADVSVFRPSNGTWYLLNSQSGFTGSQFGVSSDKLAPADYDGDGKTDVAVFRSGTWYLSRTQAGFTGVQFGASGDIPVPADYNGDGKAELAVFRPTNGTWYFYNLADNQTSAMQFGQTNDKPVAADYDGDGRTDVAVFRNGIWYLNRSTLGFVGVQFGETADKAVPADYDGDGKADVAVYRPSNGTWYLQQSTAGFTAIQFGISTDLPVPGDYDGDGKADAAVFRNGTWYLNRSQNGFAGIAFGVASDQPIPYAFVP